MSSPAQANRLQAQAMIDALATPVLPPFINGAACPSIDGASLQTCRRRTEHC